MRRLCCLGFVIGLAGAAGPSYGQWFDLTDPQTNTVCGLVNAENVVMVISDPDSSLMLVNGNDRVLANTLVNDVAEVFIDDSPVGAIEFATDRTGRRRVFWVTEIGSLYRLTPNGEPVATETFPEEVVGGCDPCEYWDITADCLDEPLEDEQAVNTSPGGILLGNLCGAGGGAAAGLAMVGLLLLALTPTARPRL